MKSRRILPATCGVLLGALALWSATADDARGPASGRNLARAENPAAVAPRATMLYTVNNLGYTDTCG